jgi:hypothetical protein
MLKPSSSDRGRLIQDFAYDRYRHRYLDLVAHKHIRGEDLDALIDPTLWPRHHETMRPTLWLQIFGPRLSDEDLEVEPGPGKKSAHQRAKLLLERHGAVSIAECPEIWIYDPPRTYSLYETRGPGEQVFFVKKGTDKDTAHALIRQRFGFGEEVEIYVW